MRICILYHGDEFPPAERIEKEAKTLASAGHEVFLLCNNYGKWPLSEERVGDVNVRRLRPTYRNRRLNKIVKFPIFINPLWIMQLVRLVRKERIDLVQVVDIPLSLAGLYVARAFRLPAVLDMWENYPEALKGWGAADWRTRVFKNYRVARRVERFAVKRFERIITVVEEQRERLVADGVDPSRVFVVTNAVDMDLFVPTRAGTPEDAPLLSRAAYSLLYVGGLTIERGLDDIIRALPRALSGVPDVHLYIAGSGNDQPRLEKLVNDLDLGNRVTFLGWLPFHEIHRYVEASDLCLVPHVANDFINTTIPNKLFQYMALAKPVLVSSATPLRRVVEESQCGWVFQSGDPEDAARQIKKAFAARHDKAIGENGVRAVATKYSWSHAAPSLLAVYSGLTKDHSVGAGRSPHG